MSLGKVSRSDDYKCKLLSQPATIPAPPFEFFFHMFGPTDQVWVSGLKEVFGMAVI